MYAANQSFLKVVAQGAAETNLAGVFLVKPLTDTKGYYLLLPVCCSDLSYCSSAFPSLRTAPDLVLMGLLSVKGSLLCCWKLPLSAAHGVPEQCKWVFPARIYWISTGPEGQQLGSIFYLWLISWWNHIGGGRSCWVTRTLGKAQPALVWSLVH